MTVQIQLEKVVKLLHCDAWTLTLLELTALSAVLGNYALTKIPIVPADP